MPKPSAGPILSIIKFQGRKGKLMRTLCRSTLTFAVMLAVLILLGTIARYVAETSLIRMVDETEQTGKHLGIWTGLRRGFSLRAGRLFLLDLAIALFAALALAVVFGAAVAPVLHLEIRSCTIMQ